MWWKNIKHAQQKRFSWNLEDPEHTLQEEDIINWYDQAHLTEENVLNNFLNNKSKPQHWDVIPAARLTKIWNDFIKYGFVRDERGIDDIAHIMIENTQKLYVNTVMMAHTMIEPKEHLRDQYDIEWNHELQEHFARHVQDHNEQWRISDYALSPLINDCIKLSVTQDSVQKLLIIDHMLNIIHARSDLAALFVEGGAKTLSRLSESPTDKESPQP